MMMVVVVRKFSVPRFATPGSAQKPKQHLPAV